MSITLNGTTKIVNDNLNTEVKTLFTPKNWIINGGFDVWQRGTSQTSSGYGSDDRWPNEHGTSTKTHSQQVFTVGQTEVPNNPTYFSRTVVTSGGTADSYAQKNQRIEDVTKLAGKTVSVSFWAKADSTKNMSIEFRQNFGTGGSTAVDSIGLQKFTLTTSWQRFTKTFLIPSVSGKTIGQDSWSRLGFWFDAGSYFNSRTDSLGNQSGTFDIANVSLVEGSVPVEWKTEAYADVLRQCQRYYQRYTSEVNFGLIATGVAPSTSQVQSELRFITEMRTRPSSIDWNPTVRVNDGTNTHDGVLTIIIPSVTDTTKSSNPIITMNSAVLTQWRPYQIFINQSGYIGFSAEL